MCKKCHKYGKCNMACVTLSNLSRKKRTSDEEQLVRDYKSYARDRM